MRPVHRVVSPLIVLLALIIPLTASAMGSRPPAPETPLMQAAEKGETETVRSLIDQGADVNAKTKDGGTSLMLAAWAGKVTISVEIVTFPLQAKVTITWDNRTLVKIVLTVRAKCVLY